MLEALTQGFISHPHIDVKTQAFKVMILMLPLPPSGASIS